MDGWEEDDNPVIEHLKHSPDCGWAINMGIEQQVNDKLKDPSSEEMLDARRMTFGVNWPHEHKRGWVCKTQKVNFASPCEAIPNLNCLDDRIGMVLLPNT